VPHAGTRLPSAAADKVQRLEGELRPLYDLLPKSETGGLSNNTVRYATHRYFFERYGWSVKGLQPAGAAWLATMSVTPDVRQISKYIAASYVHGELLIMTGRSEVDLHGLALYIAIIEHLIHGEVLEYLYSVYRMMDTKIGGGNRREGELDDLLSSFMQVYAFGTNLELSTRRDVEKSRSFLDASHKGWQKLIAFVKELRQHSLAVDATFDEVMQFVDEVQAKYAGFQNGACLKAKQYLLSLPSYHDGRVSLAEVEPQEFEGMRLVFAEHKQFLQKYGTLDETVDGDPKLRKANSRAHQNRPQAKRNGNLDINGQCCSM